MKKRQIILACLIVIMCAAVYLNIKFADDSSDLKSGGEVSSVSTSEADSEKILGESKLVNGAATAEESSLYFSKARLTRQTSRDEAVELLTEINSNEKADAKTREKAGADLTLIAASSEKEGRMENLISAKGFGENVVMYNNDSVSVVVKKDNLGAADVAKIKDIVINETKVKSENIKIVDINSSEKK